MQRFRDENAAWLFSFGRRNGSRIQRGGTHQRHEPTIAYGVGRISRFLIRLTSNRTPFTLKRRKGWSVGTFYSVRQEITN